MLTYGWQVSCLGLSLAALSLPVSAEEKALPAEVKAVLSKAREITLVSLNPDEKAGKEAKAGTLHGWQVLGSTVVKDADTRKNLVGTLEKNLADPKGAKCFDPRHAIQAEHDGKSVDLLICFECGWVY